MRKSKLGENRGPDPSLWSFVPAWAAALWRARELKGAATVWELLDLPYRPGLGRVVLALSNGLTRCENEAHEIFDKQK